MQKQKTPSPNTFQMVYGIALIAMGIGIFVYLPQRIQHDEVFAKSPWSIGICFALIGIILIGGGIKKLVHYFRSSRSRND